MGQIDFIKKFLLNTCYEAQNTGGTGIRSLVYSLFLFKTILHTMCLITVQLKYFRQVSVTGCVSEKHMQGI